MLALNGESGYLDRTGPRISQSEREAVPSIGGVDRPVHFLARDHGKQALPKIRASV